MDTIDNKSTTPDVPTNGPAGNTAKNQRGRPFAKGHSGNPAGRPPGSRNKGSLLAEALLEDETEGIIITLVERALKGDLAALRLCLERLVPPRKERPIQFALPPLKTPEDALAAIDAIATGLAEGELSQSEAQTLLGLVDSFRETLAVVQLDARLTALEIRMNEEEEEEKS